MLNFLRNVKFLQQLFVIIINCIVLSILHCITVAKKINKWLLTARQ
jgi:hypothetical protein